MANLIRISLLLLAFLLLWGAGDAASFRNPEGQLTILSILALLILVALWAFVLLLAILPAISIYAPEYGPLVSMKRAGFLAHWNPSKVQILAYVGCSLGATMYFFAVIYTMISSYNVQAFNTPLGLGTSIYFSIVTIATVGYGDVVPFSALARFVVSIEILTGMAYGVFFLSVIASFLRERPH
jgi:voltage-gated potassium channel Kch